MDVEYNSAVQESDVGDTRDWNEMEVERASDNIGNEAPRERNLGPTQL